MNKESSGLFSSACQEQGRVSDLSTFYLSAVTLMTCMCLCSHMSIMCVYVTYWALKKQFPSHLSFGIK